MFFFYKWKENLLGNKLIRWCLEKNSWLKKSKEERNLFFLLSISIKKLFRQSFCLKVRISRNRLIDKLIKKKN